MESDAKYQRKILVFFDVLGFKEMVLKKYKNKPEKIEEILSTMHLLSSSQYPSELIVFSDSVINILESKPFFNEHGQTLSDYLNAIVSNISAIQMNMISIFGVLIRGSVVLGDIRYNDSKSVLFGPALIQAYELESKHSIYPRFILDKGIMDLIGKDIDWMDVSRDLDGNYYVDSFKWLVKTEEGKKSLAPIKQKIETEINNLKQKPNLGVLSKYHWFLNKIIEREEYDFKSRT
jgi:hypothetical protein